MLKPVTTLFMLMSLDGRINTGDMTDDLSESQEFVKFAVTHNSTQDLCSLNTGKVMQKIGINEKTDIPEKNSFKRVIIDNNLDINENGINYLCHLSDSVFLITNKKEHPAFCVKNYYRNLEILYYENEIDLKEILEKLKTQYKIDQITIQSGGVLNEEFLKAGLFDYLNIIIAPILLCEDMSKPINSKKSITTAQELNRLSALELLECNEIGDSYVQLKYKVLHN